MGPTPEQVGRSRSQTWSRGFWSTARWSGTVKQRYFLAVRGLMLRRQSLFCATKSRYHQGHKRKATPATTQGTEERRGVKGSSKIKSKAEERQGGKHLRPRRNAEGAESTSFTAKYPKDAKVRNLLGEFIAQALHSNDQLWLFGIFFQLLAQAGYMDIHSPGKGICAISPDVFQYLVARESCATMLEEVAQ